MPLHRFYRSAIAFACLLSFAIAHAEHTAPPGTTRIAQWKDDKQAAFNLEFDDGIADQLTLAIPELVKRKMVGTFFLNPGKGEYAAVKTPWEAAPDTGAVVLGDHTMTHQGVKDFDNAEWEIGHCADIILDMKPGNKPRLISFALPGVGPGKWNLSHDDFVKIAAEHNLINRGDYAGHGAMFHEKTADEMVALADKALASGGIEYIVFHSIGPGTIPTPLAIFLEFLDKLETRHDRLWIIDHASSYKYDKERTGAQVETVAADASQIQLKLKTDTDPQLYDQPLTLVTQVAGTATQFEVTQGTRKSTVSAINGTIMYDALPSADPILIRPAAAH